ncbi:MAG: bifunctional phosphoribosyl-AMP cyclohydrolase/phosphoribosyl-ATP diphosphatase HisIE [Bacillota bacterium]|nr:bifunctional phosphoribosyl-AMP cyclohydrolase/phosphoribosyl-ATP diphosphatase HisIE [Bacillota bacterium]
MNINLDNFADIKDKIKFDSNGLVAAIIQDATSKQVLMMAYMNEESLKLSVETKETHFYSRSRQELWHKGKTSGHTQSIRGAYYDCDGDALLFMVEQKGVACHTGAQSCFHNAIKEGTELEELTESEPTPIINGELANELGKTLAAVFAVIKSRQQELPEGSYTTYLFNKGQDKILKKVAEEAGEVIIGSKNNSNEEIIYEISDLFYHLMVLMAYHEIELTNISDELMKRR